MALLQHLACRAAGQLDHVWTFLDPMSSVYDLVDMCFLFVAQPEVPSGMLDYSSKIGGQVHYFKICCEED